MKQSGHNDFVISLSGVNLDLSIINIEEITAYCKTRNRLAAIVTELQSYDSMDKMNYSLCMNYNKPAPRVINSKKKPYVNAYAVLKEHYKGGLLIAEKDTLSNSVSEILCDREAWEKNDVDIMLCRDFASVTMQEMKCANLLRISADPDFDNTILMNLGDFYKEKVLTLMICQMFVNENYNNVQRYLDMKNQEYSQSGVTDYIDYYELNKQLAYFIYYDCQKDKILNVDRDSVLSFMRKLIKSGALPVPESQAIQLVELITLP